MKKLGSSDTRSQKNILITSFATPTADIEVTVTSPRLWVLQKDRKSTRLNSSHDQISYAVFCLKKKKKTRHNRAIHHVHITERSHSILHTSSQCHPSLT